MTAAAEGRRDHAPATGAGTRLPAPSLRRRMACFLYEGVLLFGVLFTVGLVYAIATQQTNGMQGRSGLHVALFLALGLYFLWLWTHGGQTLAMRTWQIKLVSADGKPVSLYQALARFLASWIWFLPPLLAIWLSGVKGWSAALDVGVPLAWLGLYLALAGRHPRRQFWHDALCGTELVSAPRPTRKAQP